LPPSYHPTKETTVKKLMVLGQELSLKVSPSFLQKAACPFCLKCAYIDKVEDRYIRVNTLRGSASHEAIAELTRIAVEDEIPLRELTDDQVQACVHKHTPHEIIAEQASILKWVYLWRDRFVMTKSFVGHEEKMAIGEDYEECAWDEASYRGIVDYLEITATHADITDYKSSAHVLSQGELDTHEQLTFYAWLIHKFYPHVKTFSCRIWYLQYGFYGETRRTVDDINFYEQSMDLKIQKVMDIQDWSALPGEQCGVCDYVHLCPIAADVSGPPKYIVTQQQAELAAGRLRVFEALISGLRKNLAGYVKANDAVRLSGDFVYGFRASTVLQWDTVKLEELLRREGLSIAELVRVDAKTMKKFMKQLEHDNPEFAEQLQEEALTVSAKTQFKGHKVRAIESANEEEEAEVD
jgi:hypothetical protein